VNSKRATIRTIAKEVGLAPSTVSRALNNKPGVSATTRELVKEVSKRLGYVPFNQARALKSSKTFTVGVIIPEMKNPFFLGFLDGIEKVLFPRGYRFIVCNSSQDPGKEKVYLQWLMEHGVEGILSCPTSPYEDLSMYRKIKKYGIPVVFYDRIIPNFADEFDSVTIDNSSAISDVVFYLHKMGHKDLGICLPRLDIYTIQERLKGFYKSCELLGITIHKEWIVDNMYDGDKGERRLFSILTSKNRPTAVIATNQIVTRQILKIIHEAKLSIPNEVSIVGFDDIPENELFSPPITAVKQPVLQIGKMSTTLLLGRIDGEKSGVENVQLKAELVVRKSVNRASP